MSSYDTLYCCKFRQFCSEFLMYTLFFVRQIHFFRRNNCNNICIVIL